MNIHHELLCCLSEFHLSICICQCNAFDYHLALITLIQAPVKVESKIDLDDCYFVIRKMDRQAGGMVEYSYKRGLDFGPVVFWEHSQYNDKVSQETPTGLKIQYTI